MNIKKLLDAIQIIIKYDEKAELFQEEYIDDFYFTSSFNISPVKMKTEDVEKLHNDGWVHNKTLDIWSWNKDNLT